MELELRHRLAGDRRAVHRLQWKAALANLGLNQCPAVAMSASLSRAPAAAPTERGQVMCLQRFPGGRDVHRPATTALGNFGGEPARPPVAESAVRRSSLASVQRIIYCRRPSSNVFPSVSGLGGRVGPLPRPGWLVQLLSPPCIRVRASPYRPGRLIGTPKSPTRSRPYEGHICVTGDRPNVGALVSLGNQRTAICS